MVKNLNCALMSVAADNDDYNETSGVTVKYYYSCDDVIPG